MEDIIMDDQKQMFILPDIFDVEQQSEGGFYNQAFKLLKSEWSSFIQDVRHLREYINANEPELLQYVAKPEGVMLLVEWLKRMDCTQLREEWKEKSPAAKGLFLEYFYERTKKILDLSKRIDDFEPKAEVLYETRQYQEALQLVKPIIDDVETLDYFKETDNIEYYNFENIVQERMWRDFEGHKKEVRCSYLHVGYIYRCYAWLFINAVKKRMPD